MKGLRRILREGRLTSYLMRDRRWLALLVCLLIAALLWFLAALYSPNGYTMEIAVKLEKPNQSLPPSYSITDLEHYPDKITISVHAKGDALMGYTWRHPRHKEISIRPTIDTLLLKSEGGDYIIREQQLKGMIFSDIDYLILTMAMAEAIAFPTIATTVTINEYLNLAHAFSSDNSYIFINGILFKLFGDLKAEGRILGD